MIAKGLVLGPAPRMANRLSEKIVLASLKRQIHTTSAGNTI